MIRVFGTELSGNRQRNQELSAKTRAAICTQFLNNIPRTKIAAQFGVSRKTIYNTWNRWTSAKSLNSRPRKGRPPVLTPSEKRYLYKLVRRNPRLAYKCIPSQLLTQVSTRTIRRALKQYNIRKWKSKRRIPLTERDIKGRKEFVATWRKKVTDLVTKVRFSPPPLLAWSKVCVRLNTPMSVRFKMIAIRIRTKFFVMP